MMAKPPMAGEVPPSHDKPLRTAGKQVLAGALPAAE
jgi:hypothetical protein